MSKERRPLPPLDGANRTRLRVISIGQFAVGALWIVLSVGEGDGWKAVIGIGFLAIGAGTTYEIHRRSDPARTAGWGRQRREGESDGQRRLRQWQGEPEPGRGVDSGPTRDAAGDAASRASTDARRAADT